VPTRQTSSDRGAGALSLFPVNLEPHRHFLTELAHASAEIILPLFGRREVGLELKSDDSPVTRADRGAEEVMRRMINQRFPDHGIVGEEYGTERGDAEFVWVLDPIDGTKSFITAVPLFGTLIGLMHQGRPVLGCIHQPVLRQLMIGDGHTTTLNGSPVRARTGVALKDATLLCSDPMHPGQFQDGPRFTELCRRVRMVRTWGDCYGYLLVAAGWADLMMDPEMNPWDLQPIVPIMQGAGVVVTDWQGRPADRMAARSCVAGVAEVQGEALRLLNG
jgi:histidinol phosphatase-like enzyme (inositol monophosphatase family)